MEVIKGHTIITEMLTAVFQPEYRRLAAWVDRICKQNREAYNDPDLIGFIYNGQVYKPLAVDAAVTAIKRRGLHSTLTDSMENYLRDIGALTRDKAYIAQSLFKLIEPCENLQDVRDALPNCLCDALPALNGLSRGREEAWTIAGDPRAQRQYAKILPQIEMYAAARLIY